MNKVKLMIIFEIVIEQRLILAISNNQDTLIDTNNEHYENYVYIMDSCTDDENFEADLTICGFPKTIIHCYVINETDTEEDWPTSGGTKQLPRFGAQRYTHIFYKVESETFMNFWKDLYGRITLTKTMMDFFTLAKLNYKKYLIYDPDIFKTDYWRSQWNQDRFVVKDSHDLIYESLAYNYNQLPTNLQKSVNTDPDPSEFAVLFYSVLSGSASGCTPSSLDKQLKDLTETFNAYDMLFCDVFLFHNLTFKVDYNFDQYQWFRSFIIRDDLMSSFPPDPKVVFYSSPGITFILLQESPILWTNIFRPFDWNVWLLIVTYRAIDYAVSQLLTSYTKDPFYLENRNFLKLEKRLSASFIKLGRVVVIAAYSGMILVGYLHPTYPWSPTTFKQLNQTTHYIAATSFHSAVQPWQLTETKTLNGIPDDRWRDREIIRERKPTPGSWLIDDEYDKLHRYALFMYDDKKNYFIYGRKELHRTARYLHRLETDKEIILREMRYISVAEGATKLHFLINAIKRCFESGCWMKWKALEENYFKYVAPNVIKVYGVEEKLNVRVINTSDIIATIYIWGFGMIISSLKFAAELTPFMILKLVTYLKRTTVVNYGTKSGSRFISCYLIENNVFDRTNK